MTDEQVISSWEQMSGGLKLGFCHATSENFNSAENLRSVTLSSPFLNFRIKQSNSLLIISGDYGTYVFRGVHDIFTKIGSAYFFAHDFNMLRSNLLSADVNYPAFSIEFIERLVTFRYSCKAIELAVKKYQEVWK